MRVAREIGQDLLRTGERSLGIDDPFGLAQRREVRSELVRILEIGEIGEELQFAASVHGFETLQEQAPEQAGEHANRQEEAGPAGDPTLAIRRYAAARNDAVDMGMVIEVLAPGVQDGGDADVGAEVLGVGRDGRERLGRGREQQSIDLGLVLVGDRADRGWQREHDVE